MEVVYMKIDTSQIIKNIKKLNERAKEIYNTFGENQKQYQDIINLMSHIDDSKLKLNSKGYYSISHGKKFVESLNEEQIRLLNKALEVQTKGQIIKEEMETIEFLNPEKKKKELRQLAIESVKRKNLEKEIISNNLDIIYDDTEMNGIIHRKGRRLYTSEFEKLKKYIIEKREV